MNKGPLLDRVNRLSSEQKKLLVEQLSNGTGPGQKGPGQLVAYIKGTSIIDQQALKAYIGKYLPDYMIPGAIMQLDQFPTLPNGKINTEALPAPQTGSTVKEAGQENASQLEKILIKIWEEVLGVKPVGLSDNFFEIGGDSILSIQIVAKARGQGLNFAPNQLFLHQTVKELASHLDHPGKASEQSAATSRDQPESHDFPNSGLSAEDLGRLMDQIKQQGEE